MAREVLEFVYKARALIAFNRFKNSCPSDGNEI